MQVLDRQQVLDAIPNTWLDSLLTGPEKVIPEGANGQHIEAVLNAVRKRVQELPIMEPCDTCGGIVDTRADTCRHCG